MVQLPPAAKRRRAAIAASAGQRRDQRLGRAGVPLFGLTVVVDGAAGFTCAGLPTSIE
jgi:hypothetical protein